jgi:hypothetical protein
MARDGIHCCHVMRVASHIGLTELPVSFINPRWTTTAGIEVARLTERRSNTASQNTHLAVRHAIEMSKISHILSTVCTDDRSYDLFAEGVAELKKAICKDAIERLQTKEKVTRKRKKVDDPVQQDTVWVMKIEKTTIMDTTMNRYTLRRKIQVTKKKMKMSIALIRIHHSQENQGST